MQRTRPGRFQRGSVSLVVSVVVLPLLLILLAIGIEVSQFFGVREEVRAHLDAEMLASLRADESVKPVEARVRQLMRAFLPYLTVDDVRVSRTGSSVEVRVLGFYRGPLLDVSARLAGSSVEAVPMEVTLSARRPHSGVLLLLDRTIGDPVNPCDDASLQDRAEMFASVAQRLQSRGVEAIRLGVLPGVLGDVDIIGQNDTVPRCPGGESSLFNVRKVRGSSLDTLSDSLSIAARIAQIATTLAGTSPLERRSVVMIAPRSAVSDGYISTAFSLLENEADRQRISVEALGIVVGDSHDEEFVAVKTASGRSSYLRISQEELRGPSLRMAVLHHTQGRSMLAR